MSDSTLSNDAVVIERTFDAPVELIWQLWTDPEHFNSWYGPKGFTVPVADMDVQVGGKRLVCMASPDGSMKMWTTGEYTEIVPNQPSRLHREHGGRRWQRACAVGDGDARRISSDDRSHGAIGRLGRAYKNDDDARRCTRRLRWKRRLGTGLRQDGRAHRNDPRQQIVGHGA